VSRATDPLTGAGIAGVAVTFGSGNKDLQHQSGELPILAGKKNSGQPPIHCRRRGKYALTATFRFIALLPSVKLRSPVLRLRFQSLRLFAGRNRATTFALPLVVMAKDRFWEIKFGCLVTFSAVMANVRRPSPQHGQQRRGPCYIPLFPTFAPIPGFCGHRFFRHRYRGQRFTRLQWQALPPPKTKSSGNNQTAAGNPTAQSP